MNSYSIGNATLTSYEDEVVNELEKALKRALMGVGLQVERNAKEELSIPKPHKNGEIRPNVVTGRLRNSITHRFDLANQNVYVGTNVKYAVYVELGTSRARAYPFLKPAVENHMDEYRAIVKGELS